MSKLSQGRIWNNVAMVFHMVYKTLPPRIYNDLNYLQTSKPRGINSTLDMSIFKPFSGIVTLEQNA
jgi:hypothetical protein